MPQYLLRVKNGNRLSGAFTPPHYVNEHRLEIFSSRAGGKRPSASREKARVELKETQSRSGDKRGLPRFFKPLQRPRNTPLIIIRPRPLDAESDNRGYFRSLRKSSSAALTSAGFSCWVQ